MSLTVQTNSQPPALSGMSFEQEKLVRDMYCKDASNDEVAVFLHICRHTKLDPILKQIYFIPRYDKDLKRNKYTPQTSIDGLRLIADRTGCYSPGPSPKFDYAPNGELRSATSYVMKRTPDGTWHTIEATAYMDEQRGTGPLWNSKPRIMLAKCSEAICIKKGFPAETAGLSIPEEFGDKPIEEVSLIISQEQCDEIYAIGVQIPDLMATCLKKLGCKDFSTMPIEKFAAVKDTLERALERKKEQEFRAAQDGENV